MNSVNTKAQGFEFKWGEDLRRMMEFRASFIKWCASYGAQSILLPLAASVDTFIGDQFRPLNEKHSQKILIGHTPEGQSLAIRYEGTALVAEKVATDEEFSRLLEEEGNLRLAYFQEMLRLEYQNDLGKSHLRGFHQAGLEFFSLNKQRHRENTKDLMRFLVNCFDNYGEVKIRISHSDIIERSLERACLGVFERKKIKEYMENYNFSNLSTFLKDINCNKDEGSFLLGLMNLGVCSLDKGLSYLMKYQNYYTNVIDDIIEVFGDLEMKIKDHCFFDGGINRSLNFYSGLTFQADFRNQKECVGGGDYTGLITSYNQNKAAYGIGVAIGVERIMNEI